MKKNTSGQKIGAQMVSATDGSAFTGSVTVYVTGDAGTQAVGSVGSGACTHEGNGYHTYAPSQAETNYDLVAFTFIGTGAVPATVQVYTSHPQTGDAYAEATNGTYGLSAIKGYVDDIGAAGAGLTAVPWNAAWDAEVESEANDALVALNLDHLMKVAVTNSDVVDNSALAKLASKSATASWASYVNTTDSLEKTSDQIALITPVSNVSDSGTITYGTQISGTYANTDTDDDTRWVLAPVAVNGLDVYMVYAAGSGRAPTTVQINGYWQGNSVGVHVWAWDYHTAAWAQLTNTSTRMQSRSSDTNYSYSLNREHMDTDGAVQIRFTSASTTTTDRLRLDRVLVNSVSESSGGSGTVSAQGVWEYADRQLTALGIDVTVDAASIAAIQSGLATASALATVDSIVDDILVDTGTTVPAQIAALNNISVAQVNAEVDTALSDVGLTTTITGRIDAAISTRSTYAGGDTAGTTTLLSRIPDTLSLANINAQVDTAISDVGLTTTVTGRIDAAVTSRMATFTLPTNFSALSISAGGLVSFDPAATAFDGIVPNLAFFTNSGVGSASSVATTLKVVQSGEAGGQG